MNTDEPQDLPGDYYGVIYRGSLLVPLALLVLGAVGIGLLIRRRRRK